MILVMSKNTRNFHAQLTGYLLLAIMAVAYGCSEHITAPSLGKVTRIEIRDSSNHSIKSITDSAKIIAITEFVNSHRGKWTKPFPGTPVPIIITDFYNNDQFIGHFGVGETFFETQCGDDFCSQNVSANEITDYFHLIGED